MEDMARLALVEQNVRDTEKFNKLLYELLRFIDNILVNPHDYELRTIKSEILKSYLTIESIVDYLKYIGFEKTENEYSYPKEQSLSRLRMAQAGIERKIGFCCGSISCSRSNVWSQRSVGLSKKPTFTPIKVLNTSNPLLVKIEQLFNDVLKYEDEELQREARACVPLVRLQLQALDRMRDTQRRIKSGEINCNELPFDMALLMELLSWFKHEFFEWVDRPECVQCSGPTTFLASNRVRMPSETCLVEVYACTVCPGGRAHFPRHNDPSTLLRTRRGRCGEWANAFALLCRSLGYDTRYVYDTTDHVWCEVYDHDSKQWLHVDPCEERVDTPLMYSAGWGKKLSYVLAFSCDDLQDVTWRYTTNHKEVLKRRTACSETELVAALVGLRARRQAAVTPARRRYLARRTLQELVALMVERSAQASEQYGRMSGSAAWRAARGEAGRGAAREFTLRRAGAHALAYCCATDAYTLTKPGDDGQVEQTTLNMWAAGAHDCKDVFRKLERDWGMVYLARAEGSEVGEVRWRFAPAPGLAGARVRLTARHALFNEGRLTWTLVFDDSDEVPVEVGENAATAEVSRRWHTLELRASLSGGAGEVAWQAAQLFRQKLTDRDDVLRVEIDVEPDAAPAASD